MDVETLSLLGGRLCLDFANTVGEHLGVEPGEYLSSYHDLVLWARHAGGITGDEAAYLLKESEQNPSAAHRALARAVALREVIYRLFLAHIHQQVPDAADIAALNAALAETSARTQIAFDGDHYHWELPRQMASLDDVLWRILWSAVDLLTSDQLAQVKVCSDDTCGWLFLDTSRNQSRRWCSMADCGNRAKANRFYQRHKSDRQFFT